MTQPGHELIASLIEAKDFGGAAAELGRLFAATPTPATAQLVLQQVAKFEGRLPRQEVKVAFLRSFTIEPVFALLKACLALRGIDAELQVGDFNTYAQDILNPASSLYGFNPQIVVLAVQTRDLVPDLWSRFAELSAEDVAARVSEAAQSLRGLIGAFRSQSQAHLIVHNLEEPALASHGIYDAQSAVSQTHAIRQINDELGQTAREHAGVYVLDYDALIARKGRERWHDELKWLTARMPIAADCLIHLAREYERFFLPLLGRSCKALVVDLDNTLWGGVIGEDGMQGIRVGQEYPGATYYALQRAILDLHQRGILLAVASKNNPEDAMEVLRDHPGMLLRPEHFSAMRINWADKAMNLRQIATELNIGIDALAFLDDNPIERKRVQSELPEVTVIDLPDSPASYAKALRECPVFERLILSSEDKKRAKYYAQELQRTELAQSAGSLEDFYRSLNMQAQIAEADAGTIARIAQLTQKTNQFNLTTVRYSEQEIAQMAADDRFRVYGLKLTDRFGDNGLVGVAITRMGADACEIDTFLLSCRVIGRTVETAFLAHLAHAACADGARYLRGWFRPTKKNAPAKDFYPSHGFQARQEAEEGILWEIDLTHAKLSSPEWIGM